MNRLIKPLGVTALLLLSYPFHAQSILETDGEIHALTGGFRFPDSTLQTTAANQSDIFGLTNRPLKIRMIVENNMQKDTTPLLALLQFGVERNATAGIPGGEVRKVTNATAIDLIVLRETDPMSLDFLIRNTTTLGAQPDKVIIELTNDQDAVQQSYVLREPAFIKQLVRSAVYNNAIVSYEEIQINSTEIIINIYGANPDCYCYSFATAMSCNCTPPDPTIEK